MAEPISTTWNIRNLGPAVNVSNGEVSMASLVLVNTLGTDAFVQFFDLAAGSVVLGTTIPLMSTHAKANATSVYNFNQPVRFTTRLAVAATTTVEGATTYSGIYGQVFVQ